jgi:hypothetical protein
MAGLAGSQFPKLYTGPGYRIEGKETPKGLSTEEYAQFA